MVRESSIDVANVIDEPRNFSQTLVFSACIIPDKDVALQMIKVLADLGVDPLKEDTLNEVTFMAVCREVTPGKVTDISRRQWLSLRKNSSYTDPLGRMVTGSFSGVRMHEALDQSFTLNSMKKGFGWTAPKTEDLEDQPPTQKGTGEKNKDDKGKGAGEKVGEK